MNSLLKKYISNIFGWSTRRKIVVIESDDWGSIYMSDRKSYDKLNRLGYKLDSNHFLKYDALESNKDMEMLLNTLCSYKDSNGKNPVITGVSVVANPNFEKIKENGFLQYEYESTISTYNKFESRDKVYELLKQALKERLMVPVFHGREHLNVQRWMKLLASKNSAIREVFNYKVPCIFYDKLGNKLPDLRAAFALDDLSDLEYLYEVIETGTALFEDIYGFKSSFAILTNGVYNNSLESVLAKNGVKYLGTSKMQLEDQGNGKYKKHFHYIGMNNNSGMIYMTRNCFFEPCVASNYVDSCLKEIEIAFNCYKPAIVSSHRVNYSGEIFPENREKGIRELSKLLKEIVKKWPDVEFMTSTELGDLIRK